RRLARKPQLVLAAEARIGESPLLELGKILAVDLTAMRLLVGTVRATGLRTFIPLQPEPAQILHQCERVFFMAAHGVGVFEPQQKYTTVSAREQEVEQCREHVPELQQAGGARCAAG